MAKFLMAVLLAAPCGFAISYGLGLSLARDFGPVPTAEVGATVLAGWAASTVFVLVRTATLAGVLRRALLLGAITTALIIPALGRYSTRLTSATQTLGIGDTTTTERELGRPYFGWRYSAAGVTALLCFVGYLLIRRSSAQSPGAP